MLRKFMILSLLALLAACSGQAVAPPAIKTPADGAIDVTMTATALPTATMPPATTAATITATATSVETVATALPAATLAPTVAPTATDTPPTVAPTAEPSRYGRDENGAYFYGRPDAPVVILDYSDFL